MSIDSIAVNLKLIEEVLKYSQDQPRDDHGRWTAVSASGNGDESAVGDRIESLDKLFSRELKTALDSTRKLDNDIVGDEKENCIGMVFTKPQFRRAGSWGYAAWSCPLSSSTHRTRLRGIRSSNLSGSFTQG